MTPVAGGDGLPFIQVHIESSPRKWHRVAWAACRKAPAATVNRRVATHLAGGV